MQSFFKCQTKTEKFAPLSIALLIAIHDKGECVWMRWVAFRFMTPEPKQAISWPFSKNPITLFISKLADSCATLNLQKTFLERLGTDIGQLGIVGEWIALLAIERIRVTFKQQTTVNWCPI